MVKKITASGSKKKEKDLDDKMEELKQLCNFLAKQNKILIDHTEMHGGLDSKEENLNTGYKIIRSGLDKTTGFTDTFVTLSSNADQAIAIHPPVTPPTPAAGLNAAFRTTLSPAMQLDPNAQYIVALYDISFGITTYTSVFTSFFIYTDLVDFSYIGGTVARLLYRTGPLKKTDNTTTGNINPVYLQPPSHISAFRSMHLNGTSQIPTIDIVIYDSSGNPLATDLTIPTIITLCIRRVLPNSYT